MRLSIVQSIPLSLTLVAANAAGQSTGAERDIRHVIEDQQTAWNRGDVDAFMSGYERGAATTFVGATVTHGYEQVLANYHRRYPTREKMGQLTFSGIEVRLLDADCATVVGRWHLDRPAAAGGNTGGIFTLVFRKSESGWKIVLDHTS